jgi:prepilin-type N-terminal cleavage/methylation domain-containing protein
MFSPSIPPRVCLASVARPHVCQGAAASLANAFGVSLRAGAGAKAGSAKAASLPPKKRNFPPIFPKKYVKTMTKLQRGFTLFELLVVISIIAIALAALVPAVTSLSKSGARRAARDTLLGGIEQARAEAIKSGQATYIVFPTFTSGTQSTLDRYNYRSYAIFEDNAASPGSVKQLSDWKSFPTGVALRAAGIAALSNLADPATLTPAATFSFTPDTSAAPFRCIKFNSNGEVQAPAANTFLAVFEGYVNNGSEVATGPKDASGNPYATEYLMVSQFTGRAEPVPSPTATP